MTSFHESVRILYVMGVMQYSKEARVAGDGGQGLKAGVVGHVGGSDVFGG